MSTDIVNILEDHAIILNMDAQDSSEVIHALAQKLYEKGYVHETFAEAAIERERSLPTGLPLMGGINAAIPHTDIIHVKKPGLAMATLENPVAFHNMISPEEIVEVQFVVLMALDEAKAQVEMLQAIAQLLQHPSVIKAIFTATTPGEVKDLLSEVQ